MKSMKKICCLFLCAAMLCTTLIGCSSSANTSSTASASSAAPASSSSAPASSASSSSSSASAASSSDAKLNIHYLTVKVEDTSAVAKALRKIGDKYKETHPNFSLEFESIADRPSYLQKLKILASSEELPDWFDSDADSFFASLVKNNAVYDIEGLYKELGVTDKFFKIATDYERLDNGFVGLLSWEGNTEYFWYNTNAFKKAGIADTPKTFDELFADCEKLKAAGITPIAMGDTDAWPLLRYAAFVPFRTAGNDFIEKARTGKESFGSETGVAAAKFVQKAASYFETGWSTTDFTTAINLVTSGQAGMIYDGTWDLPNYVTDKHELKDGIGYFPLPSVSSSDKTTSHDYWAHAGMGTAVRKEAMTDAMKDFFKSVFDQYADIVLYDYNMISSMKPTERPEMSKLYKELLANLANVNTYAYCWDVRIDSASNVVLGRETPNLALGTITPEEWAKRLDDAVKQNAKSAS